MGDALREFLGADARGILSIPTADFRMKFAGIAANDSEMVAELRRIEQIVDENFDHVPGISRIGW